MTTYAIISEPNCTERACLAGVKKNLPKPVKCTPRVDTRASYAASRVTRVKTNGNRYHHCLQHTTTKTLANFASSPREVVRVSCIVLYAFTVKINFTSGPSRLGIWRRKLSRVSQVVHVNSSTSSAHD